MIQCVLYALYALYVLYCCISVTTVSARNATPAASLTLSLFDYRMRRDATSDGRISIIRSAAHCRAVQSTKLRYAYGKLLIHVYHDLLRRLCSRSFFLFVFVCTLALSSSPSLPSSTILLSGRSSS